MVVDIVELLIFSAIDNPNSFYFFYYFEGIAKIPREVLCMVCSAYSERLVHFVMYPLAEVSRGKNY